MNNNDIIKRLRYAFDFDDDSMMKLFSSAGLDATRAQISNWLKAEDHEDYDRIRDRELSIFLNGLIYKNRGKKEGVELKPEKTLTNNMILRKLKIALNYRDEDLVGIMDLMDFSISKNEFNAFFRKPGQRQYRQCKDQILRNFIYGLQKKFRPA